MKKEKRKKEKNNPKDQNKTYKKGECGLHAKQMKQTARMRRNPSLYFEKKKKC